jgi:hypothetical protein
VVGVAARKSVDSSLLPYRYHRVRQTFHHLPQCTRVSMHRTYMLWRTGFSRL